MKDFFESVSLPPVVNFGGIDFLFDAFSTVIIFLP